jgi:hypothetical protein
VHLRAVWFGGLGEGVDDAIVVIENIARHVEGGMHPFQAALQRSRVEHEQGYRSMAELCQRYGIFRETDVSGCAGGPVREASRVCGNLVAPRGAIPTKPAGAGYLGLAFGSEFGVGVRSKRMNCSRTVGSPPM